MKTLARTLRKQSTDAEKLLWRCLRSRRLAGCKFRRQKVIGPYIVDFVCIEARLIIEVDGGQHVAQLIRDRKRSACLAALGYRVIRFWSHEVLAQTDDVLKEIYRTLGIDTSALTRKRALTPALSRKRERG